MMKNNQVNSICPACESNSVEIFYEVESFPVHTVLNMKTRDRALNYPQGEIRLGFCNRCGFIYNTVFDSSLLEYSTECEESQGYSATFNKFNRQMAVELVEKYNLKNKKIVEIGSGKGDFLIMLCELGNNSGVGVDPAYVEGRQQSEALTRIEFIKDFYSEKYASHKADLYCCKMTLEHIQNPLEFMRMVRSAIGNELDSIVFFQIPNVSRILEDCAFEDIYFEHCSYFSPSSLTNLFQNSGFEALDLKTGYSDQYLMIEARPVKDDVVKKEGFGDTEILKNQVLDFSQAFQKKSGFWTEKLQEFKQKNLKTIIWGSGSKGVVFLTLLNTTQIEYVVDINPHRQGTYMAGNGQLIVSPDALKEYEPDVVIIMNAIYKEEIKADLEKMNLYPELFTV